MTRSCAQALAAALALATAATGCSNPFGPDRSRVAVSLTLQHADLEQASLRVEMGARRVEVRADEPVGPAMRRGSVEVSTTRFGEVPVRASLLGADGRELAVAEFAQRFEREHAHWIAAIVGLLRPEGMCIGTVVAVPMRAAAGGAGAGAPDTLFVLHGRLPDGAIC